MRPGQQDASGGALLAPAMTTITTHSTRYDYAHYHNRNTRFQESGISCVAKHIWYPVHAVLYQKAKARHLAATPGRGFKGSSEVNGLITLSANMIIQNLLSRREVEGFVSTFSHEPTVWQDRSKGSHFVFDDWC